jgi:hypothetical protein
MADNLVAPAAGANLATVELPDGAHAGKVVPVDSAGNEFDSGNPLYTSEAEAANIRVAVETLAGATALEDDPSPGGERGMVILAQRRDTDTPATSADGDYATLKMDEAGRLKTASQPAKYDLVSGNITANAQTVFVNCSRGSNVIAHMVATSLVGHNASFEASIDSTNGTDGAWVTVDACRSGAVNTIEAATGVLAATPAYAWEISVNGYNWLRVRATAHTSGTATWKFQQAPYATEPAPRSYTTAAQSVTMTSTTLTSVTPAINADTTTNLTGGATYTGTSRDAAATAVKRTVSATFYADVASASNGCILDFSSDGTAWHPAAVGTLAAGVPVQLTAILTTRYWRVRMINGASAQTSMRISSGMFAI